MAITNKNINQYQQVDNYTGVADADPHQLVLMLLEGVLSKLASVKGLMSRGETKNKGEVLGQAMAIVGGLRNSLNMKAGGDLASNLDDIYEYIERRLLQANINNDVTIVDEATQLIREIKIAWESIPVDSRTIKPPELVTAE